jgi:lipopolysaccharide biosynthesis glycosyltransferase
MVPIHPAGAFCPIVLACDEAYLMPLATTLRSIVESNVAHWPIECHVLVDEVSLQGRSRVERSLPAQAARIRWHAVDLARFSSFETQATISKMTFARLLMADLLPPGIERVLYLDTDILVLGDLLPLMQTELDGAILGAVHDGLDAELKSRTPEPSGMPIVSDYFNAGVLLIDLARWRANRISAAARDYLIAHPQTRFADQDALNVACNGHWKPLAAHWNFQGHRSTDIAALAQSERPAIVHFITALKPWKADSLSLNAPLFDSWRSRTLFARRPGTRLTDAVRSFLTRMNRALSGHGPTRRLKHHLRQTFLPRHAR